jgi:hypothetical protein
MRPPIPHLSRSWLRAGLALLLAGSFGFRVTATPAAWGCLNDGAGGTAAHAGHQGHKSGAPVSAPSWCACIAHGSGMSVAMDPPRLVATAAPPMPLARAAAVDGIRRVPADPHLLPFSIGPPAPLA